MKTERRLKQLLSCLLSVMIFLTSTGVTEFVSNAASNLTLHYASTSSTGVVSQLNASYNHGRVMYGIIDNEAAYCMNYGKSADGGQSMTANEAMQTTLSETQRKQLLYCMYYGHSRTSGDAPDDTARNEFIATQAMVWIIEANLFGTGLDDLAAATICNSAPDSTASNAYYTALKSNMTAALGQAVPSFTSKDKDAANTIELEWNASNSRYEKTLTDSNGVLSNFSPSISGVNYTVSGNKITFYSASTISTAKTATFSSNNGSVEITGSCLYWTTNKTGYQEFVSTKPSGDPVAAYLKIKTEDVGYGDLYKKDESTGTALKGAVYGLYTDKACTALVEKLTTDSGGYAKSSALTPGNYYLKEITAPEGYVLSDKVHTLTVQAGKTTTITATDQEQLGAITIYKEGEVLTGWSGSSFVYETKKLKGATFKVTAGAAIYRADGTKVYSKGDEVAKNLTTGSDGSVTVKNLHLGKYIVTETGTISGYTINSEPQNVSISYAGQTVEVVTESASVFNTRQKAGVSVIKKDANTKVGLKDGEYSLYATNDIKNYSGTVIVTKGTLLQTIKTDGYGSGSYTIDLPINNSYYIKETKAPYNYFRNSDDVYNFSFSYLSETVAKAEFSHTFSNVHTTARIALHKLDKELSKNIPQGDATLEGAVYGLYAREDITHPDGQTGVLYKKDSLITTLTTDEKGEAKVKGLYLGKYYVKEIMPPEGYLLDEEEHDVLCDYEGDLVAEIEREATSKDQVKKQPFQLIKAANNGETDAQLLEGVGFTAYLISSLALKSDGTYDFDNAAPVVIGENGATEIFTERTGHAVSIPIPYGTYIVRETTIPHNYDPVKDFIVKVTEHKPTETQVWRILLDKEFSAKLRIIKVDSDTGNTVLKPDAEFKIYSLDKGEYVEQITTYPSKVTHKTFFTDESGTLTLPNTLEIGNYRIEEVSAPDGYVLNENYIEVAVDSDTMYQVDGDTNDVIITVEYEDSSAVGELTVEKKGELLEGYKGGWFAVSEEKEFVYREGSLAGAEYEVYAGEDIYTKDNQTDENGDRLKYYSEGELVAVLVTDEDGKAVLSGLPLGTYRVVETKAPEGFVLNAEEQEVTFIYVDDKTPVIQESLTFANERQKVSLSVEKLDEETGLPIAGAEFGLYALEDIENVDGEVIVEADTLLETAVSGTDGMVHFIKDLPLGSYYAKETKAPLGYVSSEETLEYGASYQGQDVMVVRLGSEYFNVPTTFEITKSDITSEEELSGATLSVIDKDGVAVDTWTSVADEPHTIERLHVGETYTLREEFAPYGYLQSEEIQFTVSDTEEIQSVEMKDAVPTGTIIINKDGEFLTDINLVKGKWYDFIFDYLRKSLAGVEFEVYAAEDIVSPDGLNTLYYGEDELVASIVTNDKGIAIIENLPLGKYYLVETKTLEGFVLDSMPIQADLSYVDQYTEIVYAGMNVSNARQKVRVTVMKTDAETGKELEGAVFGLFAAENIVNTDGKVIVEKDTQVERIVTGKDGTCVFTSGLPLGQYYVKEVTAPEGYVKNNEAYKVDASYQGADVPVIELEAEFENHPTKVQISKTDITGENELAGATLSIISKDGRVVESWVSDGKTRLIERIPTGTYILREEMAPYGYTISNDVEFTVKDTEKIQKVAMKDELVKGRIIIEKKDSVTGKGIAGVEFEIRDKDGKVIETLVTDKDGHAETKKELDIAVFKNGKFVKDIKYYVVETKAAEGYILDSTPHEVVLQYDGHAPEVVVYTLELTNKPTEPKLPQTGDNANPWIYVGAGLIAVAMGVLTIRKRKDNKGVE